jgi:hypothetical protein
MTLIYTDLICRPARGAGSGKTSPQRRGDAEKSEDRNTAGAPLPQLSARAAHSRGAAVPHDSPSILEAGKFAKSFRKTMRKTRGVLVKTDKPALFPRGGFVKMAGFQLLRCTISLLIQDEQISYSGSFLSVFIQDE